MIAEREYGEGLAGVDAELGAPLWKSTGAGRLRGHEAPDSRVQLFAIRGADQHNAVVAIGCPRLDGVGVDEDIDAAKGSAYRLTLLEVADREASAAGLQVFDTCIENGKLPVAVAYPAPAVKGRLPWTTLAAGKHNANDSRNAEDVSCDHV